MKIKLTNLACAVFVLTGAPGLAAEEAPAADDAAELAKKLSNPVADLISVPIQNNWDFGIGPADGRYYAERPVGGPEWGLRFAVVFMFRTHTKKGPAH